MKISLRENFDHPKNNFFSYWRISKNFEKLNSITVNSLIFIEIKFIFYNNFHSDHKQNNAKDWQYIKTYTQAIDQSNKSQIPIEKGGIFSIDLMGRLTFC